MSLNTILLVSSILILSACSSSPMKQRKEQQAKVMQTSKLYCEFLDAGVYHDMDVALNLELAKRCDLDKQYTVTPFKTVSESSGLIYCCQLPGPSKLPPPVMFEKKAEPKAEPVKPEPVKTEAPKAESKSEPSKKPASVDPDGLE